ncbi:hypothetical protein BK788_25070 [Bacillus thuringiensis serovar sinensis]|nr:hypothetical protein BK788_25070 [Bacillus thuringiensis serovar sinensis]
MDITDATAARSFLLYRRNKTTIIEVVRKNHNCLKNNTSKTIFLEECFTSIIACFNQNSSVVYIIYTHLDSLYKEIHLSSFVHQSGKELLIFFGNVILNLLFTDIK